MRVLVVQNYDNTGLGQVGAALAEAGADLDVRLPYKGDPLPEDANGHDAMVAVADDMGGELRPLMDFKAGYVQRAMDRLPKQGSQGPWTLEMSYAADRARLLAGPVEDPALQFSAARRAQLIAA